MGVLIQALLGLLLAFIALVVWRALGWGDAPLGPEAHRKRQRLPVATVGGTAIGIAWLAALLNASWLPGTLPGLSPGADPDVVQWAVLAALAAAWGVGFVDDRRRAGLGALGKLLGQGFAGGLLSMPWWFAEGSVGIGAALGWTMLWVAAGIVALNAWNFFDNADGAATSLAALGLLPAVPLLAGAPLGFLVPNLLARRRSTRALGSPGDPLAYLGDSGSHLLGMALLVFPAAWPVFLVPVLDAGRVTLLRLSLKEPPWRGDRRHLAHRLRRAGLSPVPVVLVLLAIAAPAVVHPGPIGFAATTLVFFAAVLLTARHR